jgi:predicted RNase H-like HicB family nuclease
MSTIEIELGNTNAPQQSLDRTWRPSVKAYRCHVCTIREDDGTFSSLVLNLPGCGSCGETEEESLENVREAVLGVIESHLEASEDIPWIDSASRDIPKCANQKWILVNA